MAAMEVAAARLRAQHQAEVAQLHAALAEQKELNRLHEATKQDASSSAKTNGNVPSGIEEDAAARLSSENDVLKMEQAQLRKALLDAEIELYKANEALEAHSQQVKEKVQAELRAHAQQWETEQARNEAKLAQQEQHVLQLTKDVHAHMQENTLLKQRLGASLPPVPAYQNASKDSSIISEPRQSSHRVENESQSKARLESYKRRSQWMRMTSHEAVHDDATTASAATTTVSSQAHAGNQGACDVAAHTRARPRSAPPSPLSGKNRKLEELRNSREVSSWCDYLGSPDGRARLCMSNSGTYCICFAYVATDNYI